MSAVTLRPYQEEAIAAIRGEFVKGLRSTLLMLATGCGKTVVFSDISRRAVERGNRVLILAHRFELLNQAVNKLTDIGVDAAIEQAGLRAGAAPVVVASVQSMHPRRLAEWPPNTFGLVVVDEAHHATAESYRTILDHFAPARVLGVTATADRLDGTGLGETFQSVAYRYEMADAIRDGYLAPVRAERIEVAEINLDNVKVRMGDFVQSDLSEAVAGEAAIHAVVGSLVELSGDRKTIVFAVDVDHARALAEAINVYRPGSAAFVHGGMSSDERRQVLADFSGGKIQYLANCALLTEGFDEPSIACVAMVRPTKSRALYTQCVGRGTRLAPGKEDLLLLDYAGVTKRHVLVGPKDLLGGNDQGSGDDEAQENREATSRRESRASIARAAVVKFCSVNVDPFLGKVVHGGGQPGTATDKQRALLEKNGLRKLPAGLSKAEASQLIEALMSRRNDGLATYKQVRFLVNRRLVPGALAQQMSFEEATQRIDRYLNPVRRADVEFEP